eukprot:g18745.t1
MSSQKRSPGEFIHGVVGKQVLVKLNNGIDYRGNLNSLDGYMNVVLGGAVESRNGERLNTYANECFLRGNNVLYISADFGK